MFIKVAVRELAPATLIMGRLGLAALTLLVVALATMGAREVVAEIRANAGWLVVVALVNTAVPFWLLSWGETRIDSGLASILQAAVPVLNAAIAFVFFREVRVTGAKLAGVGIGFVGVALLVGAQPGGKVLGALAVVGMALGYAAGGLLMGRHLAGVRPLVVALTSTAISTLVALPAGIAQAPHHAPGWKTIGSVARARRPGHRARLPALLRADPAGRRRLRLARHVPDPADRARLRRRLPRRALRRGGARRPRADPRRRRARHGRCAARAPPPRDSVRGVSRRYPFLLLLLGALWGSSYLFIKVGVRDLSPPALVELRLLCAAPVLVAFAWSRYGPRALLAAWRPALLLGLLNAVVPFTLIAWGETHVDSGVAAVANSSVPIFVALLAIPFVPSERSTGLRLVGVLLGIGGVAVLAAVHPQGGWTGALGTGAVVLASVSYAAANLYAGRRMHLGGPVLAAGSMALALVLLLPLALVSLPAHAPGWKSVGSAVALGLLGTALAQILAYRVIRLYGSARAVLVAYLLPAFALLYGAVFLGESVTLPKLAGLALILGGVALGAGAARLPRRTQVTQSP